MTGADGTYDYKAMVAGIVLAGGEGMGNLLPVVEKELLHYRILDAMMREGFFSSLVFQGGTSLRLCHGSPRYSEDLDFAGGTSFDMDTLKGLGSCISDSLSGMGDDVTVRVKEPRPDADGLTRRWRIAIRTAGQRKDLPSQTIKLEVASIRSLCGILPQYGITDMPPFEAPHHTASTAALVGGGSGIAVPGAITRAHRGILFLDEAPEFSARALQTLREPLESGYVALSRSKGSTYYPASFQLIMAANPCPCGYYYGTGERCACREKDRIRYFSRLSGPILDRVDIQMAVPPVSRIAAQSEPIGESSAGIQARVIRARQVAKDRFRQYGWVCNAQASGKWLHANTSLKAMELVNRALSNHQLTLRGADRAMRLSWTLADLAGRVSPTEQDVHQGIEMRTRMT